MIAESPRGSGDVPPRTPHPGYRRPSILKSPCSQPVSKPAWLGSGRHDLLPAEVCGSSPTISSTSSSTSLARIAVNRTVIQRLHCGGAATFV